MGAWSNFQCHRGLRAQSSGSGSLMVDAWIRVAFHPCN